MVKYKNMHSSTRLMLTTLQNKTLDIIEVISIPEFKILYYVRIVLAFYFFA